MREGLGPFAGLSMRRPEESADVAIIGGGPAGLTAGAVVRALAPGAKVVVLERETQAGGIPRQAAHQGFGLRDLRLTLTGPAYAQRLTERAVTAGVDIRVGTQVTGWSDDGALQLTSPEGALNMYARAVVLATGCHERPRAARLVAGTRPAGVMTTGMLQQLVHLDGRSPGNRAVVIGAEHVAFSALATLAHGGTKTVAVVTELPNHESYAALRWGTTARYQARFLTQTAVTEIHGSQRVTSVTLRNTQDGKESSLECDTVVFTADWVPDHELAVSAGLALDAGTRGPRVDGALRTARPGLFAAGNVLRGGELADVAALEGRHAGTAVVDFLNGERWPYGQVPLQCAAPLRWISPGAVELTSTSPSGLRDWPLPPPRGKYLLRADTELIDPRIDAVQDGRALESLRVLRIMPGRSASLDADWLRALDPSGGPVTLRVTKARAR